MRVLIVGGSGPRSRRPSRAGGRPVAGARQPEAIAAARLAEVLPTLGPGDLVYLDLSAFPASQVRAQLRRLLAREDLFVGVIDPKGTVKDVPSLFHDGAVDYLGGDAGEAGPAPRRLLSVIAYARSLSRYPAGTETEGAVARPSRPSGRDWSGLVEGEEYTFSLLFIELDGVESLEGRFGAANLTEALASFREHIERSTAPFGGRCWIWSQFGGIVLFPFDGRSEQAASCGLRLTLHKYLYDVEESRFPHFVSYRLAAHLGEIAWREHDTGTLVSEALNSVFHLGQQFAPAGTCCVTDDVHRLAPEALRGFFVPAGEFEGRRIWRMRRLKSP